MHTHTLTAQSMFSGCCCPLIVVSAVMLLRLARVAFASTAARSPASSAAADEKTCSVDRRAGTLSENVCRDAVEHSRPPPACPRRCCNRRPSRQPRLALRGPCPGRPRRWWCRRRRQRRCCVATAPATRPPVSGVGRAAAAVRRRASRRPSPLPPRARCRPRPPAGVWSEEGVIRCGRQ